MTRKARSTAPKSTRKLGASAATPVRGGLDVRSGLRAGITVKQKVTEN